MTILEVLRKAGIEVPSSCESGVCGTCLTAILQGVPEHRDLWQTDEEKANNKQITVCCSRARTPELILDI
jgi:vanillate O-demethylase ferredoxin subunit